MPNTDLQREEGDFQNMPITSVNLENLSVEGQVMMMMTMMMMIWCTESSSFVLVVSCLLFWFTLAPYRNSELRRRRRGSEWDQFSPACAAEEQICSYEWGKATLKWWATRWMGCAYEPKRNLAGHQALGRRRRQLLSTAALNTRRNAAGAIRISLSRLQIVSLFPSSIQQTPGFRSWKLNAVKL